jgi:hypothetical protein
MPIGVQQTIYNFLNDDSKHKLLNANFNIIYHGFQMETINKLINIQYKYEQIHNKYFFIETSEVEHIDKFCTDCRRINYNYCGFCNISMCDRGCLNNSLYHDECGKWICVDCAEIICYICKIKKNGCCQISGIFKCFNRNCNINYNCCVDCDKTVLKNCNACGQQFGLN